MLTITRLVECLPGLTLISRSGTIECHGREWFGCNVAHQEVDRCNIRYESRACLTHIPLPSVDKTFHSGYETQWYQLWFTLMPTCQDLIEGHITLLLLVHKLNFGLPTAVNFIYLIYLFALSYIFIFVNIINFCIK